MLIDRINQIIEYKGISERKFCREIGVSNGFLGNLGDTGVSKLYKILDTYPEIDPLWLFLGTGEMLKKDVQNATQKIINGDGNNVQVGHGNESNMNNQNSNIDYIKEIERLKKEIEDLHKARLEDKEEIIRLLKKK